MVSNDIQWFWRFPHEIGMVFAVFPTISMLCNTWRNKRNEKLNNLEKVDPPELQPQEELDQAIQTSASLHTYHDFHDSKDLTTTFTDVPDFLWNFMISDVP